MREFFAASTITWQHAGRAVGLTTVTDFPFDGKVELRVAVKGSVSMRLRVRIPGWVAQDVGIRVNGAPTATGRAGTFVGLDRTWADGDRVSFELPMGFRLARYEGVDRDESRERYALEYGPVLLALTGAIALETSAEELLRRVTRKPGRLRFGIDGHPACTYLPYWQVQDEPFTCFPTLE